jgi:hypothetical protein
VADIMPPISGVTTPPTDDLTQGVHPYGFRWGPVDVTRILMGRRGTRVNYVLGVTTDHHKVEISSSGKGRSVRVWIDGKEAKV